MKAVDEGEAKARLEEILEDAQTQPIVIRRQGQDRAAVVSVADYEALRVDDVGGFLNLRNHVASEATAAGLTADRLLELLTGD
jgi:prevent-host-death family protein